MKPQLLTAVALLLLALTPCDGQVAAAPSAPTDEQLRQILAQRIDEAKQSVGIVVGIVSPAGRRVVAYGHLAKNDPRTLDGDTVFEIGSVTKVFTSLALMEMVQTGEVAVDDPVATFLPKAVKVPETPDRKMTLRDLATQTSGLPRMPTNFQPKDVKNPYADYTVDQMYAFISGYTLTRGIGERYEYSNLGVGLLGQALAMYSKIDYEGLITQRILKPLGMRDTVVTLTPQLCDRMAQGHNSKLSEVPNWDIPAMAGAGALRSTVNDLLTFLEANLGFTPSPLAKAMAAQVAYRLPTGQTGLQIAYGWHVTSTKGGVVYWHNGQTGGCHSYLGYNPQTRVGVVLLSNTGSFTGVDDLGLHLLDPTFPLANFAAPVVHQEIKLDPQALDRFTGRYQITPNFVVTITRKESQLYAQATGQGAFQVFPASPTRLFARVTEISIDLELDAQNQVTGMVLHQGGRDVPGKRL